MENNIFKYITKEISSIIPTTSLKRGEDASGEYTLLNYNINNFTFKEVRDLINNIKKELKEV